MIKIILPEVQSNTFEHDTLPMLSYVCEVADEPEFFYAMHMHNNLCEVIFIQEGQGKFIVDNVKYEVYPGDLLIFNKGVLHQESSNPDSPLKTYVLGIKNLHMSNREENCLLPFGASPHIPSGPHSDIIRGYMKHILQECLNQQQGYEHVCQHITAALITMCDRMINVEDEYVEADLDSLAYQIKDFIDNNYMNDIKLKDIASEFYISPSYLAHVVKKELGFSPIRYIMDRRIGEAQKHLLSTDLSVSKISRIVGYDNVNYFNNLFKKTVGLSPGRFRDRYETNLQEALKQNKNAN